jgi:sarcosine oxidase subunit alpha
VSGRLSPVPGEWIDRDQPLQFRFEGQDHAGFAGDVVSSALWAAGVRVLGRSFKYHRPRGLLSLANHDVNALSEDKEHINLRCDVTPLRSGLDLSAVNTWGGVARDRAQLVDGMSALMPVGFYYKAFHKPRWTFPLWESIFREMAGLGRVKPLAERRVRPKRYDFCDVLVVGAGASGLSAAITAARSGARVLVVDENEQTGGSLGYARAGDDDTHRTLQELRRSAAALGNLEIRTGTYAAGYYADHFVPLVDAEQITKLRAKAMILASGAPEQPAVFRNNDLPGVLLGSAAQRLIYRYAVKPADSALILAANREAYEVALDLARFGVKVSAIVDLRVAGEPSELMQRALNANLRVLRGACISEALGRERVTAARVCPLDGRGVPMYSRAQTMACDAIVVSVGFAPAAALLYQAGARFEHDPALGQFVPQALPPGLFAAGRVNGVYDLAGRLGDGERAGSEACRLLGLSTPDVASVPRERRAASHPYPIFAHEKGKNFVDFDEDLELSDLEHAAQEGFDSIELIKRYATVGMGPSQGKHSNMNTVRVLAKLRGVPIGAVGTTTVRPFYHPVSLSHLAGRGFTPERHTPLHARHEAAGAQFFHAGHWLRPAYYAKAGRSQSECVRDEVRAVRSQVGLIDVGTLGKFELFGPDAGELLERVYSGRFRDLLPGKARYALMLDESGVIIDDGVVARLAEDHFYFTTTTTGSATVYRELSRWLTCFGLNAALVNVTGSHAAMNLAGPEAARVLAKLTELDLSGRAFPYLGVRRAHVAGIPVRLLRVGFVGEFGYEIHTPSEHAGALWDALFGAGKELGISACGIEAQRILRLEKAHLIVGQDSDGLTTPFEAGLGWAVKMDKPFFVGQRSLRAVASRALKHRLVGFALGAGFAGAPPKEYHLVVRSGDIAGRVTSIAFSESAGRYVGLAYVVPELARESQTLEIRGDGGRRVLATVVRTPFYDPSGERQKGGAL